MREEETLMKVLVTGGAGFIGSHIVDELIECGHHVVVLDNLSVGKKGNLTRDVRIIKQDIRADLHSLFSREKFDIVIHQAGQVSVPNSLRDPITDLQVNLTGLLNLLEAARKHQVRKVIFASTAAVYGMPIELPIKESHPLKPVSPYGLTKKTSEEYLRMYHDLYGIDFTILRYANVYGPRQSSNGESGVVSIFTDLFSRGESPIIYGDGSTTRDFVFVKDIARANVLALQAGDGEIFNVSTGISTSLNELYNLFNNLLSGQGAPIYVDSRLGDINHSVLSNSHIMDKLGWVPKTSLTDGIRETLDWKLQLAIM